ncbi:MAG: primosomal protein N' [Candidatus Magasanikbacteria bacterium]|nr:primosomal protein N' [Candidatus Magasanikbacteria bacterium]
MITAKIIPLRRLPPEIDMLDYAVPKELAERLQIGQIVDIPFRRSSIMGVVFSVSNENDANAIYNLKTITGTVSNASLLSEQHLQFLRTLSAWYRVGVGALARMSLPPLAKKKLSLLSAVPLIKNEGNAKKSSLPSYSLYRNSAEHREVLARLISGTTLILAPQISLIAEILSLLPDTDPKKIVIWHSQLTPAKQFRAWRQLREQSPTLIIGTRGSIFLPFPRLDTIIIDYEHDQNHKHWDQTPRFHVKDIAPLLARLHGARVHETSFVMSSDGYLSSHKGLISNAPPSLPPHSQIKLVDMREERRARRYAFFSEPVQSALLAAKQDIFIFVHRRGFATAVGCHDCGWLARCESCQQILIFHETNRTIDCHYCDTSKPMLTSCPACRSPVVELRGAGTEFAETEIRRLFLGRPEYDVIRRESESPHEIATGKLRRIIIGTEAALRDVRWDETDVIVFADIDKKLALPEFGVVEEVWQLIAEVQYRRAGAANVYIQTFHPEHLVFRSLAEPDRLYRTELNARRALQYPPYTYAVRYLIPNNDERRGLAEAKNVAEKLRRLLTDAKKNVNIMNPVSMQPTFYRQKFWHVLIALLPLETWPDDLVFLNKNVPAFWKIDPHPISFLSP